MQDLEFAIRAPAAGDQRCRPGRWEQSLGEHAAIIGHVRERDEAAAREAMRAHLGTARQLRLEMLSRAVG